MLSSSQKAAVEHINGPAMVLAGPGSGKTTVITGRISSLVRHGIAPEHILVITFTRAAAMQMRDRYLASAGLEQSAVTFGTFHAVFFQILKHAYHYNAQNIMKEEERIRILSQIRESLKIDCEDEKEWISDMLSEISAVKASRVPLEHYYSANCPEEEFRRVCLAYESQKQREKKIDFDDMCLYTSDLFRARKDILRSWQQKYRYILIDEFQDIDPVQYEVVRMLCAPADNLFIVGDDDQSIYRFRGAKPEIMLNFTRDFPDAKVIRLQENYRSTSNIVKSSLRVIAENESRYRKDLKSVSVSGPPVSVMECSDCREEYLYLVKCIRKSLDEGIPAGEIAVLTRTNLLTRGPAEKLTEFGIPIRVRDTVPVLYDHFIAHDFMAYLRMGAEGMISSDLLRVCNRPNRYISREAVRSASRQDGAVSMEGLRSYYSDRFWMGERLDRLETDIACLSAMRPYAAMNYIRTGMGYDDYLGGYARERRMNAEELTEVEGELQESARPYDSFHSWNGYIDRYREEMKHVLSARRQTEDTKESVTLATLHSSKGLEFREVFLLDVNEEIIPYRKAKLPDEIEEERRLFYVGMTRAKERLHILCVRSRYDHICLPSRFLDPLRPG